MKRFHLLLLLLTLLVMTSCGGRDKPDESASEGTDTASGAAVTDRITVESGSDTPISVPAQSASVPEKHTCEVHTGAWHRFSTRDVLRTEQFRRWCTEAPVSDVCPVGATVYGFIRQYGITRGEFEQEYYGSSLYYTEDHNLDLLFGADEEKAEAYYRTDSAEYQARQNYRQQLYTLYEFKRSLVLTAETSDRQGWQNFYSTAALADKESLASPTAWSIADFVRISGITQKELEARLSDFYKEKNVTPFAFNYSYLYSTLAKHPFGSTPVDKINEDNAFCSLELRVSTKVWLK